MRFGSVRTGVCGGDDGSKEQTVGEEEVSAQLSHLLHQHHAAVHQQPDGGTAGGLACRHEQH